MKRMDLVWAAAFVGTTILLLIPFTHNWFVIATNARPYLMGFVKFAIFATLGELLARRIVSGDWHKLPGMEFKIIIWGLIGILIVFMFQVYQNGVAAAAVGLPLVNGSFGGPVLPAFLISLVMNLTFAPVFMAAHRITDTYIDLRAAGAQPTGSAVLTEIDWVGFLRFVVGKTIPFFWIPAHTVTFLLPPEYRVLYAAYLSIALGAILAYARGRVSRRAALTTGGIDQ